MYASLKGKIIDTFNDFIIIDVNGLGFRVEGLSLSGLKANDEAFLYIYTHYSDNAIRLFGFLTKEQYFLFEQLISVSGVGPKTASALISNLGVEKIVKAISTAKPQELKGKGVGLRTAQKIVIELSGKVSKSTNNTMNIMTPSQLREVTEVNDALKGLGYTEYELEKMWEQLPPEENTDSQELLKKALKILQLQGKR